MPEPFSLASFIAKTASWAHHGALNIGYVDHGDDWCTLQLPYDARLVGDPNTGVLASGPIATLMDMATSCGIWAKTGLREQATIDLRIDYLRPATPGRTVFGRGACVRVTRRIAFVRGEAHDGDPADPLALVSGSFMFTDVD